MPPATKETVHWIISKGAGVFAVVMDTFWCGRRRDGKMKASHNSRQTNCRECRAAHGDAIANRRFPERIQK
jgi:hypothetical protein